MFGPARPRLLLRHRRSGLSLIDLVVVTLVMGIMAAAVSPRFTGALQTNRIRSAALRICSDLQLARESAISHSAPRSVLFQTNTHDYELIGVPSTDRPGTNARVNLLDQFQTQLLSTTFTNNTVGFDLHGRPDQAGTISLKSGTLQIVITLDGQSGMASFP